MKEAHIINFFGMSEINKESSLQEFRCKKCGKLLAKKNDHIHFEIKCLRCGVLNTLIESMKEQVIVTDADGKILYANEAVPSITGFSVSEVIGQTPSLWGKQMSKDFYEKLWNTIKKEKRSIKVEVKNKKKDGTLYDASLCISPVVDVGGNVVFFVGIESIVGK